MKLGTAIKEIRLSKGISQKHLADDCGISQNALSQIELEHSFPQKGTIKAIATSLGVSTAYLLFLGISEEDVPEEKRQLFSALKKPFIELLT